MHERQNELKKITLPETTRRAVDRPCRKLCNFYSLCRIYTRFSYTSGRIKNLKLPLNNKFCKPGCRWKQTPWKRYRISYF